MTKVWCHAAVEEEYTEARIVSEEWFESGHSVFDCQPVKEPFPEITLEIRWDYPPADFFQPGTLFIVSDRLKSVLEEVKVRAEFFPVRIIHHGKEYTERAYYFCNILDCVDCLHRSQGQYTFWQRQECADHVDKISKLAIDEAKAEGHDLFRLAKGAEYIVCVSDRLAARIREQQFTGVRLIDPTDWRFGVAVE